MNQRACAFVLLLSFGVLVSLSLARRLMGGPDGVEEKLQRGTPLRPPLRFVCVSDTHGLHNTDKLKVPEGDVLLFAGDAGLDDQREIERFEAWLKALPMQHRVVVMGNMDSAAALGTGRGHGRGGATTAGAAESSGGSGSTCITLTNGRVLCDSIEEVAGYRILGSPWTPAYYGQWQLADAATAREHWARVLPPDADVDIIMTHGPPYGFGDESRGKHVGDRALLEAVQALAKPPLLWVCGHIHESYGQHRVPHPKSPEGILLINAAVNNINRGEPEAAPRAVDLPAGIVHGPTEQRVRHLLERTEGQAKPGAYAAFMKMMGL